MESTNRVLTFLQPTCQCRRIKRRLHELHQICEKIEQAGDNAFILLEPAADEIQKTGEATELGLIIALTMESCAISDDIPQHTVCELRRVAERMAEAADRIDREFGSEVTP